VNLRLNDSEWNIAFHERFDKRYAVDHPELCQPLEFTLVNADA